MKQVVKIPSLGDAENTEVIEICVKPGDRVSTDDSIVVLESEKAAMDVPASKTGIVSKVLVNIGDEVKEGDDFLEIEVSEEAKEDDKPDKQQESSFQEVDPLDMDEVDEDKTENIKTEQNTNISRIAGIYAGPAVRKLAREFGIDLNKVSASGPRNRILKEDLHRFVKSNLGKSQLDIPEIPTVTAALE